MTEYYPQESALLNVARERIYDEEFLSQFRLGATAILDKAGKRQIKNVLKECKSDTEMFLQFSSLLYAHEKKWQKLPTDAERQAEFAKSYQPFSDLITALMAVQETPNDKVRARL